MKKAEFVTSNDSAVRITVEDSIVVVMTVMSYGCPSPVHIAVYMSADDCRILSMSLIDAAERLEREERA